MSPLEPSDPVGLLISAIVVNFNTREMTLRCLRELTDALKGIASEVWVVDNGSSDNSVAAVRESFPTVNVVDAGKNLGFGVANNVAMEQARGEYFLLLNSDAFPKPGSIAALLDHLERHPEAAVAGPRLLNEDSSLQQSCYRFPSPFQAWLENLWITVLFRDHPLFGDYRFWPHDQPRSVDFAIGACLLVRRSVVQTIGGFDHRFFMYQEEADWQKRMHNAGWEVTFTPDAEVTHLGGGSGKNEVARINRHFFESLDIYSLKHHGRVGLILTRAAMLVGCSLRAVLWAVVALTSRERTIALSKMRKHVWLVNRQLLTKLPELHIA